MATAIGHGRRCTNRLHLYAHVWRSGFSLRGGSSLRSGAIANDASITMTASGRPIISGWILSPTPTSAIATNPAAMMPRQREISTLRCAKPSSAGSNVTEAIIVMSTVIAAPVARPLMNDRPMMNMPSSEITTVKPAKTTARPAVSSATTVDCSGSSPAFRPSR